MRRVRRPWLIPYHLFSAVQGSRLRPESSKGTVEVIVFGEWRTFGTDIADDLGLVRSHRARIFGNRHDSFCVFPKCPNNPELKEFRAGGC